MKLLRLLSILFFLPLIGFSQDFGCFTSNRVANHDVFCRSSLFKNKSVHEPEFFTWDKVRIDVQGDSTFSSVIFQYKHSDNKIKAEGKCKNGLKEGKWNYHIGHFTCFQLPGFDFDDYHINRNNPIYKIWINKAEGEYVGGKKNGTWTFYSKRVNNGEVSYSKVLVLNYKNDELNGPALFLNYHTFLMNYQDNVLHGEYYGYDTIITNRHKVFKKRRKGKKVKIKKEVRLICKGEFQNGLPEGTRFDYEWDGCCRVISKYSNGKLHGQRTIFTCLDGDTLAIENYNKGQLHGRYIYNDARDFKDAHYEFGKLNGECRYDNYSGVKLLTFKNDSLEGEAKFYYKNGQLAYRALFSKNRLQKVLAHFDSTGKELNTGTYLNGDGVLNTYFPNGILRFQMSYKNYVLAGDFIELDAEGDTIAIGKMFTQWIPQRLRDFENSLFDWNQYQIREMLTVEGSQGIHKASNKNHFKVDFYNETDTSKAYLLTHYDNNPNTYQEQRLFIWKKNTPYIRVQKHGFNYRSYKSGVRKFEENYYLNDQIDTARYYDEWGDLVRQYIILPNGAEMNVFLKDTVNYTDSLGHKQGRWIRLAGSVDNCELNIIEESTYRNDTLIYSEDYYSTGELYAKTFITDSAIIVYQNYNKSMQLLEERLYKDLDSRPYLYRYYHPRKFYLWKEYYEEEDYTIIYRENGKLKKRKKI